MQIYVYVIIKSEIHVHTYISNKLLLDVHIECMQVSVTGEVGILSTVYCPLLIKQWRI